MDVNAELKDQVMPEGRWVFDESVTQVFQDMLARSIPGYVTMRDFAWNIIETTQTIENDKFLHCLTGLDLGASLGEASLPLIQAGGSVHMNEYSDAMRIALKDRFSAQIANGRVTIDGQNLIDWQHTEFPRYDVVWMVLVLMFLPIECRLHVLKQVHSALVDDGVFIYVEKTETFNNTLVAAYYNYKRQNGYTQEQIDAKRESLRNVLTPISSNMHEELLRWAGFTQVQPFFQTLMFKGWVVRK